MWKVCFPRTLACARPWRSRARRLQGTLPRPARGPGACRSPDPSGDDHLPRAQRTTPADRREDPRGADRGPQGQARPACGPGRGARSDTAQRAPSAAGPWGPRGGHRREHDGRERRQGTRRLLLWC